MKWTSWAFACALTGSLFIGDAMAQGLRQPLSVQPAGFDYNRYLQDEVPSPSDVPAAPAEEEAAAEAPATVAPAAPVIANGSSCGCSNTYASCYDTGCQSCGGNGFGLGLGNCCLGQPWELSSYLLGECSDWNIGGWAQVGYHDDSTGLFNSHPGHFNLHQGWLFVEKQAQATACSWDWGVRADFVYGVDAQDTQAFGNTVDALGNPRGFDNDWDHGIYGWAIPQLYGEVAYGDWNIRAGHFLSLTGYETIPATGNFFYSHSYTMYNSQPFTHTGVLATYSVSNNLQVFTGWTLGWDTGFDQFDDGNNYLGGIRAQLNRDVAVSVTSLLGDFGWRGDEGYLTSFVLEAALTDRLDYVWHSDVLRVDETGEDNFSIVNYLFYTVNDCLRLGSRLEWWRTDDIFFNTGNFSVYEATFGANIKPHANVTIRPEIRQDWSPALDTDETIFGVDFITVF